MSEVKFIAGIDPGLKGGIAVVSDKFDLVFSMEMCKETEKLASIIFLLSEYEEVYEGSCEVFIEKAQVMSGAEGKVGMQNYMKEYGRTLGMMDALRVKYTEIATQTWKSRFDLIERRAPGSPKPTGKKEIARDKAERRKRSKEKAGKIVTYLFDVDIYTEKGRLKDGEVEAILIATYGMERLKGHTISQTEWQGTLAL